MWERTRRKKESVVGGKETWLQVMNVCRPFFQCCLFAEAIPTHSYKADSIRKVKANLEALDKQDRVRNATLKDMSRPLVVPAILNDLEVYNRMYGEILENDKDYVLEIDKLSNVMQCWIYEERRKRGQSRQVGA